MDDGFAERRLKTLQETVIRCQKCERILYYLREVEERRPRRYWNWSYWSKPLPSFGDPRAKVLIIGLAPSAHGGNRTGRLFTGDRSGEWLFEALHRFGFANRPASERRDDDFQLKNCYLTATVRCAPPENKPTSEEIEACRPYLLKEFDLLKNVRVIVSLGRVAYVQTLTCLRLKGARFPSFPFGHGKIFHIQKAWHESSFPEPQRMTVIATYHPSQQNTFTRRLTRPMFYHIFEIVCNELKSQGL